MRAAAAGTLVWPLSSVTVTGYVPAPPSLSPAPTLRLGGGQMDAERRRALNREHGLREVGGADLDARHIRVTAGVEP